MKPTWPSPCTHFSALNRIRLHASKWLVYYFIQLVMRGQSKEALLSLHFIHASQTRKMVNFFLTTLPFRLVNCWG